jgi:hypothetical protein
MTSNNPRTASSQPSLFDKTFRDGQGNLAVAQWPNLPILVWAAASLLKQLPLSDRLAAAADIIAFGTLFTWAWMELFQGVNYFRRFLGLVVLGLILAARL